MRRKKKNKAKQKRDSERENIQSLCPFATFFNTRVLCHIDECSISAGRNKRRTNRTNTNAINQSPHNLKRKSKERNYYDEMEKMKREKQFCSKSLTSIISPIPLLANECQLSDEQLTSI
jgi:hypothetical protein